MTERLGWIVVAALACTTGATLRAQDPPAAIDRVTWLQGCWTLTAGDRTVDEQWMAPRGGTMLGTSRTVRGGKLAEWEVVLLREEPGGLVYQAHPSGQPAAMFPARDVGDRSIVFENPAHDFPQRIGYRLEGDALLAWIEGTRNGQSRRVEYPFRRTACRGED